MNDVSLPALHDLHRLILRINANADLATTLRAVVDGVVEGLGFGVAVVNLVHGDDVTVVAVSGSDETLQALIGATGTIADWDEELAVADHWGGLRFVPHGRTDNDSVLPTWIPDLPASDDPNAWHPEDALFAPLTSKTGDLVGILSVDLPADGRRPGPLQRELLEMYAVQAALAIDNARLTDALKAEQRRLRANESAFRLAFEAAPVGMSLIDFRHDPGRFLRVNAAMCRMLGYSEAHLLASTFTDITHPDSSGDDVEAMGRAIEGKLDTFRTEKKYVRADGSTLWVAINTSVVRDSEGVALYGITQFEDISDRRRAHLELSRLAKVDPLTGLLNRSALLDRVDVAIQGARSSGRTGALLFCDLDRFKPVNDNFGHVVGDQVLAVIARRLESQVRADDSVGRFGGDEFVVVAEAIDGEELDALVERLRTSVAAPVDIRGTQVSVTMTIGQVSIEAEGPDTPAALLEEADAAMYRLKP